MKSSNNNNDRKVTLVHLKDIVSNAYNWHLSSPFRRYDLFYGDKYFQRIYYLKPWQQVFVIADEPGSCLPALLWSNVIHIITLLSCILYILGSVREIKINTNDCDNPVCSNDSILCPNIHICEPIDHPSITKMETGCAIIFSIDYFLRVLLCVTVPSRMASMQKETMTPSEKLELQVNLLENNVICDNDIEYSWYVQIIYYVLKPIHLVDLMAILPFLITSSGASVPKQSIGILKIFRVFRLVKIVKSTVGLQIMIQTFVRAREALQLLVFFSFIAVILFASLAFFFEEGTFTLNTSNGKGYYIRPDLTYHPERSPYESIPAGMYWAVVTMTTVGYGDIYPTGQVSRTIACLCMYIGLLVFALPISVIGSNFEKLVDDSKGATAELMAESVLAIINDQPDLVDDLLSIGVDSRLFGLNELKKSRNRRSFVFGSRSDDETASVKKAAAKERYRLEHLAKNQARSLASVAIFGRGLLNTTDCDTLNSYLSELGIDALIHALDDPDFNHAENFNDLLGIQQAADNTINEVNDEGSSSCRSFLMNSTYFKWQGVNLLTEIINLHTDLSHTSDKEERQKKKKKYEKL